MRAMLVPEMDAGVFVGFLVLLLALLTLPRSVRALIRQARGG